VFTRQQEFEEGVAVQSTRNAHLAEDEKGHQNMESVRSMLALLDPRQLESLLGTAPTNAGPKPKPKLSQPKLSQPKFSQPNCGASSPKKMRQERERGHAKRAQQMEKLSAPMDQEELAITETEPAGTESMLVEEELFENEVITSESEEESSESSSDLDDGSEEQYADPDEPESSEGSSEGHSS
jgi:hypothetical protein